MPRNPIHIERLFFALTRRIRQSVSRGLAGLILLVALLSPNLAGAESIRPMVTQLTESTQEFIDGPHSPAFSIDNSTLTRTFVVNPGDFSPEAKINKVTLWINFAKTSEDCTSLGNGDDWAEEIFFTLRSPGGVEVSLVQGDYQYSDPEVGWVEVLFDDSAATSVTDKPISSGTFRSSSGTLHLFNGISPSGTWSLVLTDNRNDDPICYVESRLQITASTYDLQLEKTAEPEIGIAGEELIYRLRVTNFGPDQATGIELTDTLPTGLTYLGDNAACSHSNGQVTCDLADLNMGEAHEILIQTRIDPDLVASQPDGTVELTNLASVSSSDHESDPTNNTVTLITLVQDQADLRVLKVSKPDDLVRAGEPFTYTIYVDNLGPSYAREVQFTDETISANGFQVVAVLADPDRSDSCSTTPNPGVNTSSATIQCSLSTPLEPWGNPVDPPPTPNTGRWAIQVVLRSNQDNDIDNAVQVFAETPDPDLANNLATDFISVLATADLQSFSVFSAEVQLNGQPGTIINTNALPAMPEPGCCNLDGATVTAGRRIEWSTTVLNPGPSTAENVQVRVLLPYGASLIENTLTGNPGASQVAGRCTTEPAGELRHTVVCSYGTLAVGSQAGLRFQVLIDPDLASGAQLSFDSLTTSDTFELAPSDNVTSIQFDVNNWADLGVQKYGNSNPIPAGSITTYDLVVTHKGPSTAHGVQVLDVLPAGMDILDVQVIDGLLTPVDCHLRHGDPALVDSATCELGDLPPGTTVYLVVTARARPDATPGWVTNLVNVSAGTPDPYFSDNLDDFETQIVALADLRLSKRAEPFKVLPGGQVKFILNVENTGPSDAQGVMVTDTLPPEMTYETSYFPPFAPERESDDPQAPEAACSLVQATPPQEIQCALGDLAAGASRTIEIWARVHPNTLPGTSLTNRASVESLTLDPTLENNGDFAVVYVEGVDLSITKVAVGQVADGMLFYLPDQVSVGHQLVYTLTVENLGGYAAQNVVVKDFLPAGIGVISITPSHGVCQPGIPGDPTQPLTCYLGSLDGGATTTIVITASIPQATPVGTQLYNLASVTNDIYDSNNTNGIAQNWTVVRAALYRGFVPWVNLSRRWIRP